MWGVLHYCIFLYKGKGELNMLNENDIMKINTFMDKKIVNENIINNPDRNITSTLFKCYANHKYGYLCAWSYEMADLDTMFKSTFSSYMYKLSETRKEKKVPFTIDVSNLSDAYMILKMKYVVKPEMISDKYRYAAYENTINDFDNVCKEYQYQNDEIKEKLIRKFNEEINDEDNPLERNNSTDKELQNNLFTGEQIVVIPIIDKTNKYILNDISYYGVYNNNTNNRVTSLGEYSVKCFRESISSMVAVFIGMSNDENPVAYIRYYGKYSNPYILLYKKDVRKVDPADIIKWDKDERVNEVLRNTYKEACDIYDRLEKGEKIEINEINERSDVDEYNFIEHMTDGIKYIIKYKLGILKYKPSWDDKTFEHIGTLEEEIYEAVNANKNSRRTSMKKLPPSSAVKRINLKPLRMITLMKIGNSGRNSPNRVFASSTTSPNPIDIFNMFSYHKKSNHVSTRNKIVTSNNTVREDEQYIVMNDMRYLGQFAPKSAKNLGAVNTLHFNLSDDYIKINSVRKEED